MHVDNQHKKHTGLVVVSGIVGAGTGAVYAINHMAEARLKKIAKLDLDVTKFFNNLADCFDVKKAESAIHKGIINRDDFNAIKNLQDKFLKYSNDEQKVKEIANTPINERKIMYNESIKIANKSRLEAWKASIMFPEETAKKLSNTKIFNKERWMDLLKAQFLKTSGAYKIMAKPIFKGLAIGAGIGALIGLKVKSLLNKN